MFTAKCRGTAILIHRDVFNAVKVTADKDDQFVTIQRKLYNFPVVLVNFYPGNYCRTM